MLIQRLIDEPYISEDYLKKIEDQSVMNFNHIIKEAKLNEQVVDAGEFLELIIYNKDPNNLESNYWGLHTMLKYKIFFSGEDYFVLETEPNEKLSLYTRNESLISYLETLNAKEIELRVLYFICEKRLNIPNIQQSMKNIFNPKYELLRIIAERPEYVDYVQKYIKSSCLDYLLQISDQY
jgi:hypothetical protein